VGGWLWWLAGAPKETLSAVSGKEPSQMSG
jgi:hypothetical protein